MATLDKLVKTVESLRLYQSPAISMDQNLTKKEKMTQCSNVAENVCQQALVKSNSDFSKYLTVATEMFFTLSNDEDADIRLLADECLTKVVKQLSESGTNVGRIQVELYKEIKKNGSSRSLRSALSKFAAICKQIRPQKCRAYIVNLIPCLIKIATTRKEEAVHETLAEAMNTLFSYLGHYANDNEIDQLLKTFLNNLSDPSPSIRRSTASILTSLCVGSRKPPHFTLWLFKTVISNCIPCTDPHSIPNEKVLGLLVGSRPMIPLIARYEAKLDIDANVILEKSLQLYELCICLMNSADVTIVAQALETLQQLLGHPSIIFKQVLTSPSGIRESSIYLSKGVQDDQKEEHESLHETLEDELHEDEESMTSSLERGRIKLMDSVDIPSTPNDHPDHDNQEESEANEESNNPFEKERPKSGDKGDIGSFLDKDVPLIFCSRKLVMQFLLSQNKGKLIPDSKIRVSTKALAIGCLTHAITMAPKVFLLTLYSDSDEEDIVTILIRDVANYTQHEDPQLRGSMVILIGQVLKGALVESGGDLALWYNGRRPDHNDTLQILKDLLDDELASAMATKHILSSALKFLPPMLKSIHSRRSISLLKDLLSIPYSSSYKYWLVKVELCKLLSTLPYMAIHHIVPDQALQEACIGILLGNLGDDDSKVREKAATALTKAHFYWPQDGDKCSITSAATKMASKLLLPIIGESIRNEESNHQRLTFLLQNQLLSASSQSPNMTSGTIQALLKLSESGLVSMDLLNYCSKILSSRSLISADISFHANILKLISNLVKSMSHEMKKTKDLAVKEWKTVCGISQEISTHCFVVLNICQHLIDCIAPDSVSIKSQSGNQQVNQNSITNPNASPIKLKLNELTSDSKKNNEEQSKKCGQFNESHHYMRLFENLRNLYTVERNSLGTQEKVKSLMIETLGCLQHLLEYTTSDKSIGKITEELLTYLKSTFAIDPFSTLKCVEALLRCIFATHFAATANQASSQVASSSESSVQGTSSIVISQNGLFFPCFDQPYNELVHTFHLARDSTSTPDRSESMLFRQTALRSSSSRRTSKTSVERSTLSNYIRLFEPMVIRALKHYTITSNVEEQSQVLQLLIQLVHLRVNYCLLDSDKIFVTFVLKQLDLIEEGQMYRAPVVIPEMFRFLVLLSYEKYHSKPIIDVPKILQLCEGLFASGQHDETFVMPALIPVAEDLFCSRTTSDQASDLEAQREVMITMLIKLLPYSKVLSLATRMLRATKSEGDDRWRKLSRILTEALIPLLAAQKIHIEEKSHLDLLHQIFAGLAPGTLRPVDPLLSAVLTCTVDLTKLRDVQRWLGFVVLSLPILTNQSPEEAILARLEELGIQMMMTSSVSAGEADSSDSNVVMGTSMMSMESSTSTTNSEFQVKPEVTLAKFLLQAIGAACTKFHQLAYSIEDQDLTVFLRQELSHLLLFVIYMFQSGRYYRVTKAAKTIAKQERDGNKNQMLYSLEFMTEMFIQLAHICPFITLQWCYILKLMQHSPQSLWYKVLQPEQRTLNEVHPSNLESESLNYEILRKGSLILLCDYLCENTNNVEYTTWVIVNYTQNLLSSVNESPVQDFVMSVHRSPSSSGLLLQAVMTRVSTIGSTAQVAFLKDALNVVENVHKQFAGKLVTFLVNKYLVSPHLSLTKQANFIACTRVEAMINSDKSDVMSLFTDHELSRLLETLKSKKLTKKFGRLSTLLNRVATDFFDLSPITGDDLRTFHPGSVSQVHLNREWLLGQIKVRCCHPDNMNSKNVNFQLGRVCAEILNSLEEENEILEIMSLKDFSNSLLASCLAFDAKAKGPLYSASKKVLIRQVNTLVDSLPRPFGLFKPSCWSLRSSDHRYSEWLENHFHSADFQKNLSHLLPAVQVAFETKAIQDDQEEDNVNALTRLTVLIMEFCKWIHCDLHGDEVATDDSGQILAIEEFGSLCLKTVALALNHPTISGLCKDSWATSMVLMLNDIIYVRFSITTNQVPICPAFKVAMEESQETPTIMACIKLSELFSQIGKAEGIMPEAWYQSYKDILLGLCRLDRFTAYVRIPPELWTLGWSPMVDLESLAFPSIPIDYLHDKDILEVYVKRLLSLGWRSRTQFEESWMALLGVFSLSKEDLLSDAEVTALAQASTVAVSAITGLLLQTLMLPQPGHPGLSTFIHHSRDTPRSFLTSKRGQQLTLIQNMINEGMKDIQGLNHLPVDSICNIERSGLMVANYGLGQLSLHFIQSSIRYNSVSFSETTSTRSSSTAFPLALIQREDAMSLSGLDTRSCLQFLQELYGQWLTEETPLGLLTETVRSMLALSDLFTETSQFQWMFDHFNEIQKTHPVEDEMLTNLLRIGLCKCIATVCGLASSSDSSDLLERIRKSLESGIKAANLSTRIGCIHSFLYLVQCEENNPEVTKEVVNPLMPQIMDYLQTYLQHSATPHVGVCEVHVSLMWSMAFYILENHHQDLVDQDSDQTRKKEWCTNMLKLAINEAPKVLETNGISHGLYLVILTGLERLVIEQSMDELLVNKMVKMTTDLLTEPNPVIFIPAVQLFLASMYSNKIDNNEISLLGGTQDPEQLMQAMEQMSILFDCVRRSGAKEAQLLCKILPKVLVDFFSASDVMNRVINEFISPGQPHQVLLSGVLFAVFQQAAAQDQLVMMQQWVLSSLPNFTKRSPVSHSMWCLTVFFISAAADNPYLQALFPYLQQRFGCYCHEDKRLFCLAARHFYFSLGEDKTSKEHFLQTVKSVAQPRTPYYDLLKSIESCDN